MRYASAEITHLTLADLPKDTEILINDHEVVPASADWKNLEDGDLSLPAGVLHYIRSADSNPLPGAPQRTPNRDYRYYLASDGIVRMVQISTQYTGFASIGASPQIYLPLVIK